MRITKLEGDEVGYFKLNSLVTCDEEKKEVRYEVAVLESSTLLE